MHFPQSVRAEGWCTFQTYSWNTIRKQAIEYQRVQIPYSEITDIYRDRATGCTVCEEDQKEIHIDSLKPFKVCNLLAPKLEDALNRIVAQGALIQTVTAYRVGKTRGDIDSEGNRTEFSNHSFGIALDINETFNGLYDNCINFDQNCHLIRGGGWNPDNPESLTESSIIVREMEQIGLLWGGKIAGKQKDFMHFSPSGY